MLMGQFQPRFDQFLVLFGRLNALARFFLKAVQHVDAIAESDGIHCAIGIAIVVFHNLKHSGGPEAFERLGLLMFKSALCQIQSIADDIHHSCRHFQKVLL
jgi:hypothetical protein